MYVLEGCGWGARRCFNVVTSIQILNVKFRDYLFIGMFVGAHFQCGVVKNIYSIVF